MTIDKKAILIVFVGLTTVALAVTVIVRNIAGSSFVDTPKDGHYEAAAVVHREPSTQGTSRTTTNSTVATKETEMKNTRGSTDDKASKIPRSLTKDEETILHRGFTSAEKSLEIGQICLKHRLPKQQVIALLGKPHVEDTTKVTYNLAPSQWLDIQFDATGNVVRVEMSGRRINLHQSQKSKE